MSAAARYQSVELYSKASEATFPEAAAGLPATGDKQLVRI